MIESMIDLNNSSGCFPLITDASKGAPLTVLGLISGDLLFVSTGCFPFVGADILHRLSHRTDVLIELLIVIKLIGMKRMLFEERCFLFLMEVVVFDKG